MTCRVCGRAVEVSDSGQPMPCICVRRPSEAFLLDCVADCVGPAAPEDREHARRRDDPLRLAEWRTVLDQAAKRAACPDCAGSGRVAVHVCADERECARTCLRVEACAACGGTGQSKEPRG